MSNKDTNDTLITILRQKDKIRKQIDNIDSINQSRAILSKDFSLYHIEELTFEDDFPRKEALENVLSSLEIDGISFVYLLLGNTKGVSFYFGIAKDFYNPNQSGFSINDIGNFILKPNIEGNFRGSKIIEQNQDNKNTILQSIKNMKNFARVDGVPSVNIDSEDFQGVDRLVDVMLGDEFSLMVLADPLSLDEIQEIESSLYKIYNKLSPLAKLSVQESSGKSDTEGEGKGKNSSNTQGTNNSKSNTTNNSKTVGNNSSKSKTYTSGTTITTTKTNTITKSKSSSAESAAEGSNQSNSDANSTGDSKSETKAHSETINYGSSSSETIGSSETLTKSKTLNEGINKSRDFSDKIVNEWMEYIDEILLKRVEYGRNKGIFNTAIYLCANEEGTLLKLGNTLKALFSGTEDNKAPLKLTYIEDNNEIGNIKNLQIPSSHTVLQENMQQASILFSKSNTKFSSWISANELSVIAGLPKKEVIGLPLREEVEFGLNLKKQAIKKQDSLLLGNLVRSGTVLENIEINIDKRHLNKHTFITGVTGSGKTTTCQRILKSANMPFMVIEPAKTEYRVLMKNNRDILTFTLGDDSVAPFRINPFEFFKGENITSRVDMIKANIEAAFDMEAAIPQIIETSLYRSYEEYGWDIATSTSSRYEDPFADGVYSFPTLSDLIKKTGAVVEEQGFDDRLKNDYIGSIKARLQGLLVGAKGFMLNTPRSVDFTNLLEKDVIFELEEIKNGDEKSLVMGFVLINLNEALKIKYKEYKKDGKEFQHITLIEEAHRLLSKYTAGDNPSKKLGVETFSDMLAEVRKYGESLIIVDQIPDKLTPEVLKNTNTKIVHKLFASDDKNAIGNTMALDDDQKVFLSSLEVGRAIISNQDFSKPVQVQIRELEDVSTTISALIDEEDIRKQCLRFYQKNYKRGVIQGLEIYEEEPTLQEMEKFLTLKMNGLVDGWSKLCAKGKMAGEFAFDIKKYLEENKLENKLEFVSVYILNKFYNSKEKERKKEVKISISRFLDDVLKGRVEFTSNEHTILRIR